MSGIGCIVALPDAMAIPGARPAFMPPLMEPPVAPPAFMASWPEVDPPERVPPSVRGVAPELPAPAPPELLPPPPPPDLELVPMLASPGVRFSPREPEPRLEPLLSASVLEGFCGPVLCAKAVVPARSEIAAAAASIRMVVMKVPFPMS